MQERIKAYILESILEDEVALSGNDPLFSSSLLSSMGYLKLINFLQRTFDISISTRDVNIDNFDTINQISEFVQSRMAS